MSGEPAKSEEPSLGYAGLVAAKQARIHAMIQDVSSQSPESAPAQIATFEDQDMLDSRKMNACIDRYIEAQVVAYDERAGIETKVIEGVFFRQQQDGSAADLYEAIQTNFKKKTISADKPTSDKLQYAKEIYRMQAIAALKFGLDYCDIFLDDPDKGNKKKEILDLFRATEACIITEDGKPIVKALVKSFNQSIINTLKSSTISTKEVKKRLEYIKTWSPSSLAPHDLVTIDKQQDTYHVASSISAPSPEQMVHMAVIALHSSKQAITQDSVLQYVQATLPAKYKTYGQDIKKELETEIASLNKQGKIELPAWYQQASARRKKIIEHYADNFINGFMCVPVLLSEEANGKKTFFASMRALLLSEDAKPFPASMRAFHAIVSGAIREGKAFVSSRSLRSGAPSRVGNLETTKKCLKVILGAIQGITGRKDARAVEAALVTHHISTVSKEPDAAIISSLDEATKGEKKVVAQTASVLMKRGAKSWFGKKINHDQFKLLETFNGLKLDETALKSKGGETLFKAYQKIQFFGKHVDDFDVAGITFAVRDIHQEITKLLSQLKIEYQANPNNEELLRHIRFLEAVHSYQVIQINNRVKHEVGQNSQPLIETAIEHQNQCKKDLFGRERGPMRGNHYQQWMLGLESIIGSNYDVLRDVAQSNSEALVETIIHEFCKDGRDRTGVVVILTEFLNDRFDSQISKLLKEGHSDGMIPSHCDSSPGKSASGKSAQSDALKESGPAFEAQYQRVIARLTSGILCGLPQSGFGHFGLLKKILGKRGIYDPVVGDVTRSLQTLAFSTAEGFNTFETPSKGLRGLAKEDQAAMDMISQQGEALSSQGLKAQLTNGSAPLQIGQRTPAHQPTTQNSPCTPALDKAQRTEPQAQKVASLSTAADAHVRRQTLG